MSDYISRQTAIDALARTMPTPATPDGAGEFDHEIHIADEAFADAIRIIESIEPVDAAPVAHSRWIKYTGMGKVQWMCEKCSAEEKNPKVANYCYHCGAKMDGGES